MLVLPGGAPVVEGAGFEAAVQDDDEAVRELSWGCVVADVFSRVTRRSGLTGQTCQGLVVLTEEVTERRTRELIGDALASS